MVSLLHVYRSLYPNVDIVDISGILGDGDAAVAAIEDRISNGEAPPDAMQISSGFYDIARWTASGESLLEPLVDLWEREGWTEMFPPETREILTWDDGRIYGVPIGMHRFNNLITNKDLVPDPPSTYSEFIRVAASSGPTPVIFLRRHMDTGHHVALGIGIGRCRVVCTILQTPA